MPLAVAVSDLIRLRICDTSVAKLACVDWLLRAATTCAVAFASWAANDGVDHEAVSVGLPLTPDTDGDTAPASVPAGRFVWSVCATCVMTTGWVAAADAVAASSLGD